MTPAQLLALFEQTAAAIKDALDTVRGTDLRDRTSRPGQYALDVVADKAALEILNDAPVTVVSEESGVGRESGSGITVVIDPVDGSSNAARGIPYWATSLCALDSQGPLAAMVINQATGVSSTATRGGGAFRDGIPISVSSAKKAEESVIALSAFPGRMLAWKQFRSMGSCALALCDVASGAFDGYMDGGSVHAPWDYLGGLLICTEAGGTVIDVGKRPLAVPDPHAKRQLIAAGTPQLVEVLRAGRMTDLDLHALARAAITAAHAGGAIVSEGFGSPDNVREKAPGDWVSDVDTASEQIVKASLASAAPEIPFFGEEAGGERAALGWICDPLDGTANFLHGFPAVGVSVGLVRDGVPIVGVVHAPLLGDTYVATLGGGATCNGEPLHVSMLPAESAITATGFPFRHKDRAEKYLRTFGAALHAFEDLRRAGAASLDLAWTAAGVFDGYFELSLGPWDVAAGALLVREAGGVVTDWTGDPGSWLSSGDIVAAPPAVHARILEVIAGV